MNSKRKANCVYDLSFPFHKRESAADRLANISSFMAAQQLPTEYLIQGTATEQFEAKIADLFGKPAAMWCSTGTLAQGIAARIHSDNHPDQPLLLHCTSHLLLHEQEGYHHAHGLDAKIIGTWRKPITADLLSENAACAFIELPQRHSGGRLPTWEQLTELKQRAAQLKIPLHMDGARIWSSRPYYNHRHLSEIADGFDSVYVSLYKDIGAIGGALLIGEQSFIEQARIWRARLGGLLIEPWPMIYDALRLLEQRLQQIPEFVARAKQLTDLIQSMGTAKVDPQPPHTNQFHVLLPCNFKQAEAARDCVADKTGVWLASRFWSYESDQQCAMEMTVGEKACDIPDQLFADAMTTLLAAITRHH